MSEPSLWMTGWLLCCTVSDPSGVFWIDWKSVCRFFDVVYINWKPKLFEHKSTIHELVLLWRVYVLVCWCVNVLVF